MKLSHLLSALSLFAVSLAQGGVEALQPLQCRNIPDAIGRAGMAAVVLSANEHRDHPLIMMTGGANFPHALPGAKTPAERGAKVYYKDVQVIRVHGASPCCGDKPMPAGSLESPIGYAAFAPSAKGMVLAGGCNDSGHVATVTRTDLVNNELVTEALPSLPLTTAYPAFAVVNNVLYVMGGQEKADSTACLDRCFALDLNDTSKGWKELAPMPGGRMLATAGVDSGRIYVVGGCSLHPDAKGQAERTYLAEVLCYDPASDTWTKLPDRAPETIVGAANPMPAADGKLYLVCGDPGNYYRASLAGKAPATHPGQNVTVYSFTPATGKWEKEGANSTGIATAPAVMLPGFIYVISGETHPGIRTPLISTLHINK